jgi:hypothetical protein
VHGHSDIFLFLYDLGHIGATPHVWKIWFIWSDVMGVSSWGDLTGSILRLRQAIPRSTTSLHTCHAYRRTTVGTPKSDLEFSTFVAGIYIPSLYQEATFCLVGILQRKSDLPAANTHLVSYIMRFDPWARYRGSFCILCIPIQ